nr:MAG TPA: hypothetical protein [Caudoviricetes sp.]
MRRMMPTRCKYNDDGELVPDDDIEVFVTEL